MAEANEDEAEAALLLAPELWLAPLLAELDRPEWAPEKPPLDEEKPFDPPKCWPPKDCTTVAV